MPRIPHRMLFVLLVGCNAPEPTAPDPNPPPADDASQHSSAMEEATRLIDRARADSEPAHFDEAELLVAQALEAEPCNPAAWTVKGKLALERWHYGSQRGQASDYPGKDALEHFERALSCEPDHQPAIRGRLWYYELMGDHDRILEYHRQAVERSPDDERALMDLGTSLLQAGLFEDAVAPLAAVVEQRRARGDRLGLLGALEQLGRANLHLGRHERAEDLLAESITIMEELKASGERTEFMACPYVALGQLYRIEGNDHQGAEMFTHAADAEPHRPASQFRAAEALYWLGETQQAELYIDRALALDQQQEFITLRDQIDQALASGATGESGPVHVSAAVDAAARAFDRYDFAAAEAYVEQIPASSASPKALLLQALAALMQARYDETDALLKRAESAGLEPCDLQLGRAHLAIARKDYGSATQALQVCIDQGLDQHGAPAKEVVPSGWGWLRYKLFQLGLAWVATNEARHPQAIEHFDAVLTHQPRDRFALIGKGNALNAQGDLEGAEAHLRKVLEVDPDNMYAIAELGLVSLNRGDLDAAKASFERAAGLEPESYTCPHEGLGMVYMRQGQTDLAREHFEKAISINPEIEYKKYNGLATIYMDAERYDEARALLQKSIENYPHDPEAAELMLRLERLRAGQAPEE